MEDNMFRIILGSFLMLSSVASAEVYGTTCFHENITYNVLADTSKGYVKLWNEQGNEVIMDIDNVHNTEMMVVVAASKIGNVVAVHFSKYRNADSLLRYDVKLNKYVHDDCGESIH
jgi:acyl-coenzyme A synthetase/AMP-(fatty) acid ligase